MKVYKIQDFKKGWVIGNFEPSVFKHASFEAGMKFFKEGETEGNHYQNIATEVTFVAEGIIEINGVMFSIGDVIVINPNEVSDFKSVTSSKLFCIKFPSIPSDKIVI